MRTHRGRGESCEAGEGSALAVATGSLRPTASPGQKRIRKNRTMFHTTTAPLHKAWNCQWCRPGDRYLEVPEHLQREGRWICVRTRERRSKA